MKIRLLLILPVLTALAGCFSYVSVAEEGGRKLCIVENTGWKLLSCIPIASGDVNYPNQEVCSWFEDTVTLENNIRMLNEEMASRNVRGVRDLCSYKTNEKAFFFLFKRYTYHTSAELVP